MQVWNVLHAACWKHRTQKSRQKSPSGTIAQICRAISSQLSSERQPNFAALNRGRHLSSAGRPSSWAIGPHSSLICWSCHVWSLKNNKKDTISTHCTLCFNWQNVSFMIKAIAVSCFCTWFFLDICAFLDIHACNNTWQSCYVALQRLQLHCMYCIGCLCSPLYTFYALYLNFSCNPVRVNK